MTKPGPSEATPLYSAHEVVMPKYEYQKIDNGTGCANYSEYTPVTVKGSATPSTAGSVREALEREEKYLLDHFDAECGIMPGDVEGAFHRLKEALSAPVEAPVAVKALEWEESSNIWLGNGVGTKYLVFKHSRRICVDLTGHGFITWCDTYDEAKAAAQADYEQRIRSALIATPRPLPSVEQIAQIIDGNEYWTARTKATAILTILGGSAR